MGRGGHSRMQNSDVEVGLCKVCLEGMLRYLAVSDSYVRSNQKLRCKDELCQRVTLGRLSSSI